MSTQPSGRYLLKSLHEEIGFFDRKIAHLEKYETFPSDKERTTAADKLVAKRNLLIRKAQQMIDEGIEFNELERPKSLRPNDLPQAAAPEAPAATPEKVEPESVPSPHAGTSLDYRSDILAYKMNKASRKTA